MPCSCPWPHQCPCTSALYVSDGLQHGLRQCTLWICQLLSLMIVYCKYPDPLAPDPHWTPPEWRTYIQIGLSKRLEDFLGILKDESTADCSIVLTGPHMMSPCVFRVHSLILANRCPQLTVGFQHNSLEASTRTVHVTDASPDIFRLFLELLYAGGCMLKPEQAIPMFVLCDKYMLAEYAEQCLTGLAMLEYNEHSSRELLHVLNAAMDSKELSVPWVQRLLQPLDLDRALYMRTWRSFGAPFLREVLAHPKLGWSEDERFMLAAEWVYEDHKVFEDRSRPDVLDLLWSGIHWGLVTRDGVFKTLESYKLLTQSQLLDILRMKAVCWYLPSWMRAEQALPRVPYDEQETWTIITDEYLVEHHRAVGPVAGLLNRGLSLPVGSVQTLREPLTFQAAANCDTATFCRLAALTVGQAVGEGGRRLWSFEAGWNGMDHNEYQWMVSISVHPMRIEVSRTLDRMIYVEPFDRDDFPDDHPLYERADVVTVFVKYFVSRDTKAQGSSAQDCLLYIGSFRLLPNQTLSQVKTIWLTTNPLSRVAGEWKDKCPRVTHLYQETHSLKQFVCRYGGMEALSWGARPRDAKLKDGDILIMAQEALSAFQPRDFSHSPKRHAEAPEWEMVKQRKVEKTPSWVEVK